MEKSISNKLPWYIQYANYDLNQADKKEPITCDDFIKEFESFPWKGQLEKYQKDERGCSPTIAIYNTETNREFNITIFGEPDNIIYLVGNIVPRIRRQFYIFGKLINYRWLDIYITEEYVDLRQCIKCFFDCDYHQLGDKLIKLDKYSSQVACDLVTL